MCSKNRGQGVWNRVSDGENRRQDQTGNATKMSDYIEPNRLAFMLSTMGKSLEV